MIIKAKVLPWSNNIMPPPTFSNTHKQYLIEKNKKELPNILHSKKPKNQKLKRYLNKISEIKNIVKNPSEKFLKKPNFKSEMDNLFNNDVNLKRSRKRKLEVNNSDVKLKKMKRLIKKENLHQQKFQSLQLIYLPKKCFHF